VWQVKAGRQVHTRCHAAAAAAAARDSETIVTTTLTLHTSRDWHLYIGMKLKGHTSTRVTDTSTNTIANTLPAHAALRSPTLNFCFSASRL